MLKDKTEDEKLHHEACLCVEAMIAGQPSLAHYRASPDKYVQRAHPERLNWGPWMSTDQLAMANLTANRMTRPGDWDYEGVALEV